LLSYDSGIRMALVMAKAERWRSAHAKLKLSAAPAPLWIKALLSTHAYIERDC
jgi:hypothetical protein